MTEMTPDQVLQQLKQHASTRTQRSLDAIFQVCMEQQSRGLNEFSYATVAKLGAGRGVPAAQSIRNKTGEPYRTLIKSFVDASPKPKKMVPSSSKGISYSWIDELEDPVVRLQANILYSEKKQAEKLLREVVPINQVIEVFDGGSQSVSTVKLSDLERSALKFLLSSEFLRRNGLEHGKNGTIVKADTGESFFPVATIDAIKKALANL